MPSAPQHPPAGFWGPSLESCDIDRYTPSTKATVKAQPWKQNAELVNMLRQGTGTKAGEGEKLLVACPKRYDYGSSGLGGS